MRRWLLLALLICTFCGADAWAAADGNRLTYLDGADPYYPGPGFARLTTPQWVGELGVDAVVILSIDDMRLNEAPKYEQFLRPILNRLKQIDGRAALSIMTCQIDPKTPQLQEWLKEGVSLETHTIDHPCPLLHGGDFAGAKSTYDRCVDMLASIPGSKPVAFRMPCCDSLNTPSPRFFAEIFNKKTSAGAFLTIDSSVFNIMTEGNAGDRFSKYAPFDSYVNTIFNYPYPYVIGKFCWEFPCATPSDWQAQHLHGSKNAKTVDDWKALLDVTVAKQGVMPMVFHPHGWSSSEQFVELIDYAAQKYGKRVKFLSFKDANQRLNTNVLADTPLRSADGYDNLVRVLDLNADGYMDVVLRNGDRVTTRVWEPATNQWREIPFPSAFWGAHFGIVQDNGAASVIVGDRNGRRGMHFDGDWKPDASLTKGLPEFLPPDSVLRDIDHDGRCELIVPDSRKPEIFGWHGGNGWQKLPFTLPPDTRLADNDHKDTGLRFVDVDGDCDDDIIFSDAERYGFYRFVDMKSGWERVLGRARGEAPKGHDVVIPPIVVGQTNNGAWFHSKHLWVQNENTAQLPNHVDRVAISTLLAGPLSPEQALKTFKVQSGFVIQLAVAEPMVMDPVAFNWGADGKLYIVEMGDYPNGVDDKGAPGGVVRVLQDTDGDGKYDKSTVFLDKLGFPNGVTPYKNGVIITCAPDIFYAEDTDNDGKADKREVLFTGFGEGNQQHRVNGLIYGLDNWFYGANGDSGGQITSTKTGKTTDISGRDFRLNIETGEIDTLAGQSQFGRARDDWGNWVGCNNSNPAYQFMLDDHYIRRNPYVAAPPATHDVSEVPGASEVFPTSKTAERFNMPQSANHFTSACSVTFYRDELAGSGLRGNTIVSEPVHNLVHREFVWQDGLFLRSRRAEDEIRAEFITSTDNWFRPTSLRSGPDGALWVADMYRLVIEHPRWIPKEFQEKLDLRAGHDKGRIYRVYHGQKMPRPIPNLAKLDTETLVKSLESPGSWERDMAQQVLVERQDKAAIPHLEKLVTTSTRALARLGAICTLDGLNDVKPAVLIAALDDQIAGVRANAVRIAERRLKGSPELATAVLTHVKDPDPTVRRQLAYSLGEWDDPRAGEALGAIALRDADEPYITAAVLSSVNAKNLSAVTAAVTSNPKRHPSPKLLSDLVMTAAGLKDNAAIVGILQAIANAKSSDPAWQFTALAGALDGAKRQKIAIVSKDKLTPVFDAARETAIDDKASADLRAAAVDLLARGSGDDLAVDVDLLGGLLTPQTPESLQAAAIARLSRVPGDAGTKSMLAAWQGMTPALRLQTLDAFLQRPDRLPELLGAIEQRKVLASDFDASRRRRLLEHSDVSIRARAEKIFAGAVNPDRQKVIDAYSSALTLQGDLAKGKIFFAAICATCHKVGDLGVAVGPDLLSLADHSPQYYLLHVLDPNRAVESRYTNYVVETKNGQMFTGVLTGETGNSVTVTGAGGKPQTILRADLKRLRATPLSAMPEGLETGKTPQDFADLFAFLAGSAPKPTPKTFPGNKPAPVKPTPDTGIIRLVPESAEIYGSTVMLEEKYGNLGYWSSPDDRAAWMLESAKPGAYDVVLEWACADGNAGLRYVLKAGASRLAGAVKGTGTWDEYQKAKIGRIVLPPGVKRIEFGPEGFIAGSLIDLKSIELVPAKD